LGPDGLRELLEQTQAVDDPDEDEQKRKVLRCVQDFVQALLLQDMHHPQLVPQVWRLVDKHYKAIGKARARKKKPQEAEEKAILDFLTGAEKLLCRTLKEAGSEAASLLRLLERCQGDVEVLHDRLWWATFEPDAEDEEEEEGEAGLRKEPNAMQKLTPLDDYAIGKRQQPHPEFRPLRERLVLDVEVTRGGGVGAPPEVDNATDASTAAPDPALMVLLANLPLGATEDAVRLALGPCGELRSLELCDEWLEEVASAGTKAPSPSDVPEFTHRYALVEFETEEAQRRSLRKAARLFGILMDDSLQAPTVPDEGEKPKKTAKAKKNRLPARPAYPQDVLGKSCLLLRRVPWSLEPHAVLEACARILHGGAPGAWKLVATNCGAFSTPCRRPLHSLAVHVETDGSVRVLNEPVAAGAGPAARGGAGRRSGNGGAAVLRFERFELAYMARRLLSRGLLHHGITVGFPPWRPLACEFDSGGQVLDQAVLVDMPLIGASACYGDPSRDPVRRWGSLA